MSNPQPDANIAPDNENPPPLAPLSRRQRWARRALIALAALVYEIIWVTTAFDKVNPTDLDVFFFPATRIALAGHPLDIYQLRVGLIYPNANGPLGIAPVLLAAWLADMRGWLGDVVLRRALVFAITAPFPLLAGWEAARIVERFGGRLRGLARALPYLANGSRSGALAQRPLLWPHRTDHRRLAHAGLPAPVNRATRDRLRRAARPGAAGAQRCRAHHPARRLAPAPQTAGKNRAMVHRRHGRARSWLASCHS